MLCSDFPAGAWITFGGSFERGDVLLVVHHPGDLGGIEAVFVDEDAAGPHAGRHRIGAHADLLAFEVLGQLDPGIRPHDEAAVMKAAHEEDRQRDVGSTVRARDHIGRRRHLADVELELAHHPPEGLDDRLHLDDIGVDAFDRHAAVLDRGGVAVAADRDLQPGPLGTGRYLGRISCTFTSGPFFESHCFGMPAVWITFAHLAMSFFMRSLRNSGGPTGAPYRALPCASGCPALAARRQFPD